MLAQAGGPRQVRRIAQALGVRAQHQGDAVIGTPVAVPIAALEEPGQCIQLHPGLGRLQFQAFLACRGEIRIALEGVAAIDQHQRRAADGQGHTIVAIARDLIAVSRRDVHVMKAVLTFRLVFRSGAFADFHGFVRHRRHDGFIRDGREDSCIYQRAQQVGREHQDLDVPDRLQRQRLLPDRDLAVTRRHPLPALRLHALQ